VTSARTRARARAVPLIARIAAHSAQERVRPVRTDDAARVPTRVEDITPAWLTAALSGGTDVRIVGVEAVDGTSGTTSRCRLRLWYDGDAAAVGLPDTVFTKSSPTLLQRITQAVTGPVEARFYTQVRGALDIEAPGCFHGVVDERRMAAVVVLEDLVATRAATFLGPTSTITRAEAEDVVGTLAKLHGTFAARPAPAGFKTYVRQWEDALALVDVESAFRRCLGECGDLLDERLREDPARTWRAVRASIALHENQPSTLLHNDVHLGNWFRSGSGALGLCDWQAVVVGHWSRDLAYALTTILATEDRRAWEHELVALYTEELQRHGGPATDPGAAFARYREQVWGALAFWAPTYSPPRRMPSDMQPREVSGEMLRRIGAACVDLDAFGAVSV
jgi:thiamine kinase-like enzyme